MSKIYSDILIIFPFLNCTVIKVFVYRHACPVWNHLRNLYCIIWQDHLIYGTIASHGTALLLENLMLISQWGDWGCAWKYTGSCKKGYPKAETQCVTSIRGLLVPEIVIDVVRHDKAVAILPK